MLSQKTSQSNARRCAGDAHTHKRRQHALTHSHSTHIRFVKGFSFSFHEKNCIYRELLCVYSFELVRFDSTNHVFLVVKRGHEINLTAKTRHFRQFNSIFVKKKCLRQPFWCEIRITFAFNTNLYSIYSAVHCLVRSALDFGIKKTFAEFSVFTAKTQIQRNNETEN